MDPIEIIRSFVEAMPKCCECGLPATRHGSVPWDGIGDYYDTRRDWCDTHAAPDLDPKEEAVVFKSYSCDARWARAVREAVAFLSREDSKKAVSSDLPPAYYELTKRTFWTNPTEWGRSYCTVSPLEALRAVGAPAKVIGAIALAMVAKCMVSFERYSCVLGGWDSVVVYGPVSDNVKSILDAIDASGIRDGSHTPREGGRWHDPAPWSDQRPYWEWVIEGD